MVLIVGLDGVVTNQGKGTVITPMTWGGGVGRLAHLVHDAVELQGNRAMEVAGTELDADVTIPLFENLRWLILQDSNPRRIFCGLFWFWNSQVIHSHLRSG